ncbi:MAG: hypothetical protein IJ757_02800 [Clostridiales bacterium]|nr:hypothetical protein [Clostridiales bacterium]
MDFEFSTDGFLPYDSFDYIYKDRKLPEFGDAVSPYVRTLSSFKFFLAQTEGQIPFGVEADSFDDSDWDIVNVPSTWQTEGYGLPQNLLYNYPSELEKLSKRGEESISDKFILKSVGEESDEVGIYRTTVVFTPQDIDRALYLETSGICGSFDIYLNGQLLTESHSVMTRKRILLSDSAKPGTNQLTIVVYRWDRDSHGRVIKELMNFGFSGLIRPVFIVAEPLLEISNLHLGITSVPDAYVDQLDIVNPNKESSSLSKNVGSGLTRGNFSVVADFRVRNHTDIVMPYQLSVSLMETRQDYDPYKLPLVQISIQSQAGGTADSHSTRRDKVEFVALNVATWNDATPVLYDLIIELMDSEGRVICVKKKRFGFRTADILADKFHINDVPVKLNLVRYYEFDPKGGISVPLARFRQDIILMKRCGINGVIGEGFPLSDEFLNLCDQYGLYVIACCDRRFMRDYAESAVNHPCVVMWAFNDYRYDKDKCLKVKNEIRSEVDPGRTWYCGADDQKGVSDVLPFPNEAGIVYGPWEDLCLDRKEIYAKNKTGKSLFENIPGRKRFSDDNADYKWIHHADLVGGKNKDDSCIGQGIVDAERNPHPIYLDIKNQCNTINIFSHPGDPSTLVLRNAHPFAFTPELLLEWTVMLGGHVVMSGRGTIPDIEPYGTRTLKFPINIDKYLEDGWAEGKPELVEMYMGLLSHQIVFSISLKLSKDTYYAKEGFEMAFYQDIIAPDCGLPGGRSTKAAANIENADVSSGVAALPAPEVTEESFDGSLTVMNVTPVDELAEIPLEQTEIGITEGAFEETSVTKLQSSELTALPEYLQVAQDSLSVRFDRKNGALCGLSVGGTEFIKGSMMPSFYRCPSNIDRTDRSFILSKTIFSNETDYEQIQSSIKFNGMTYGVVDEVFSIVSRYKSFAMKGDILVAYEVPSPDVVRATLSFTPKYDMVRYGFRVPVARDDILCTWYGRGPGESYYDRKNATRIGEFSAGVDKIFHSYARPAENSSHTDTDAMRLQISQGSSVVVTRVSGDKKFDFTVLPFTPEQMNESLHDELLMQNDFCELMIDFCSKEIERTDSNTTNLPLKKNVPYKETFEIRINER